MPMSFDVVVAGYNFLNGVNKFKAKTEKKPDALRFGILGAAAISYMAFIDPTQTHPDAVIVAIAARQKERAQAQINKYKLGASCKAYGSYDELLANPEIDAVYIPLPNGLHAEWTIKALEAGKHVLVEKPIASNADEARKITAAAERANKVALEAFHWRFYPAAHRTKQLIESGIYGNPISISTRMKAPGGAMGSDDIRFSYKLGGGASMDLTYVFSTVCYFTGSDITTAKFEVLDAKPDINKNDKNIDNGMKTTFTITQSDKPAITCHTDAHLANPPKFGFLPALGELTPYAIIELEKARIEFHNFVAPHITHSIKIIEKDANGKLTGKTSTEKVSTDGPQWGTRGQPWWTTYRYQLEAFVDGVRAHQAGKPISGPWTTAAESEKLMELIDAVYDKSGLPRRGV